MVTTAIGVSRLLADLQPPTAADRASCRSLVRAGRGDMAHK